MPEIVRFFTGEEPILHNVPTWRCREKEGAVPRARQSRRPRGQGSQRLGRLRHAGRSSRHQARDRGVRPQAAARAGRLHRPADAALSTCPTFVASGVAPRHVDLRPFVLAGADDIRIVPGGLTRVALKEGSLVVQFEPGRWHQGHLGARRLTERARAACPAFRNPAVRPRARPGPPALPQREPPPAAMLSRTADNLYWLSRYAERADFVARILDAALRPPPCRPITAAATRTSGNPRSPRPATSSCFARSTTASTSIPSATSWPSAPTTRPRSAPACRPPGRTPAACARR